jgi:RNA polymerase sigma-70 factor (ECF subfamily)
MSDASAPARAPDLLPRIAQGDQKAVRECLDRYAGLVWSLARRFSTTETDAEDAVQEIFLEVWKSAGRFDASVASEVTFIAMIARRRLIDRRRRESRRPSPEALSTATDVETSARKVDDPAREKEDVGAARRALAQLTPDQRHVLQLSIFHGLSHDRIARTTGLPLGTVKTHARRGLIRIREIIESERAPKKSDTGVAP